MKFEDFDTLSMAMNALLKKGYEDGYKAEDDYIVGTISKNKYKPEDLLVVKTYRFEGMTNPADDMLLMAIEAKDGNKGTFVMSHSAEHSQNVSLIRKIPIAEE